MKLFFFMFLLISVPLFSQSISVSPWQEMEFPVTNYVDGVETTIFAKASELKDYRYIEIESAGEIVYGGLFRISSMIVGEWYGLTLLVSDTYFTLQDGYGLDEIHNFTGHWQDCWIPSIKKWRKCCIEDLEPKDCKGKVTYEP